MTFGLLSAGQMALAAGLTGAAVLLVFLLKVRHPLVVVPSLVLWQRVLDEHRRDSLIERLRRLLSFLLALAIAWLLVVAAGEPRPDGVSGGRLSIVVDNGLTMNALVSGNETRLERAVDAARAAIEQAGGDARFQVADTSGVVRTPAELDRQEALEAVLRIRPGFGAPRVPAAASGYELVLFTDGVDVEPPEGARIVSFAGPVPNVGITAFEVRTTPGLALEHTAYLSIVNFDRVPRSVEIAIGAPGQPGVQRTVPLAAGASFRQILPVDELPSGAIEARVTSEGDRFPLDDRAYAWLPTRRALRVALVTPGQPALAAVLASDPRVNLEMVDPADVRAAMDADLIVFDRVTPEDAPRQPSLLVGPTATAWFPLGSESRTLPSLTMTDTAHPLMSAVTFDDVHVTRSAVLAAPDAVPLASDATHALVAAGAATAPWVALGFSLDDSNFATQPAFPIFIANVLTWLRGEAEPILARTGLVEVPWPGASVTDLGGRAVPSWSLLGSTRFTATGPGVFYAASRGLRVPVVVNLPDRQWAPPDMAGKDGVGAAPGEGLPDGSSRPWWMVMAMAALLLLLLEWWTWQRRITV